MLTVKLPNLDLASFTALEFIQECYQFTGSYLFFNVGVLLFVPKLNLSVPQACAYTQIK